MMFGHKEGGGAICRALTPRKVELCYTIHREQGSVYSHCPLSRHQVRLGSALKMTFGHKEQEKE